jgi:hypothetical protein
MIIGFCLSCEFHEIKKDGKEETSHCQREACWSRYSNCITAKALENFLKEQSYRPDRSSSIRTQIESSK